MSKRVPPTPAATKAPFFAHQWRPLTASPRPLEGMCSFPGRHTETAIRDRKPGAGAPGAPPGPGGVQPGQEGGRGGGCVLNPTNPLKDTFILHTQARAQSTPAPGCRSQICSGAGWGWLGGGSGRVCVHPSDDQSAPQSPLRTTNRLPGWRSLLASRSQRPPPPRRVWEGTRPRRPHLELGDMNINSASVPRTPSQTLLRAAVSSWRLRLRRPSFPGHFLCPKVVQTHSAVVTSNTDFLTHIPHPD